MISVWYFDLQCLLCVYRIHGVNKCRCHRITTHNNAYAALNVSYFLIRNWNLHTNVTLKQINLPIEKNEEIRLSLFWTLKQTNSARKLTIFDQFRIKINYTYYIHSNLFCGLLNSIPKITALAQNFGFIIETLRFRIKVKRKSKIPHGIPHPFWFFRYRV